MPPRFSIPDVELAGELGQGAHSVVYRGSIRGVPCAVKLPKRRAQWTRWIYREAIALARVRHAALPRVLSVGETEGLPYLVMELAEGEPLSARLRQRLLVEQEILALGETLAGALAAVHEARLVHRDVKPANIMLGSDARVRLVDFGFAAPFDRTFGQEEAGTLRYAAPEQLRAPTHVDGRADLYALGRVLQECALGDPPGESDDVLRALERAGLSRGLATVLADLTASDADRRYPRANALAEDFQRVGAGLAPRGPRSFSTQPPLPRLVARDDEMRRALQHASGARPVGGTITVVEGGRGAGKSLFLSTFAQRLGETGAVVLRASCRVEDPPLAALRRLFDAFLSWADGLDLVAREGAYGALRTAAGDNLAPFVLLVSPAAERVLPAGTSSPTTATTTFAEGLAELFVRLSRRLGRLVLAIDDLAAMDPASREVLVCVAHRVREAPLTLLFSSAVVGLSPAGGNAPAAPLGAPDPVRTVRIELPLLGHRERAELIANYLGAPAVDPDLLGRIDRVTDGTPLGILEVLGAFLDDGALRLRNETWELDVQRADLVALPEGSRALLGHRLARLPEASRAVLDAAAVLGVAFDPDILSSLVGVARRDLGFALALAQRAGVIEPADAGSFRFVHESLRETLRQRLSDERSRLYNARAWQALEQRGGVRPEELSSLAMHHVRAGIEAAPARAAEAARAAADAAYARYDDETARRFYRIAHDAQDLAGGTFDADFFRRVGEVALRIGELDESLAAFERALTIARGSDQRALLLGRVAWVHHVRGTPDKAWEVLARAFAAVGARMPIESAASALSTAVSATNLAVRAPRKENSSGVRATRAELELLSQLHYQNARLGLEYDKPFRLIQSTLAAREACPELVGSRSTPRARALYAFLLTITKQKRAAELEFAQAQEEARRLDDPVTDAFIVQLGSVGALWGGEMDRGLRLLRELVDQHGPWLEVSDYALSCFNADILESIRGRNLEGWAWLERALERFRRSPKGVPPAPEWLRQRVRATFAAFDRDPAEDPRIVAVFGTHTNEDPPSDPFLRVLWWGAAIRAFTERGDLGGKFEALVRAFERERYPLRMGHPALYEFYVAVAHARVHQCLRASPLERSQRLRALGRARDTLEKAAGNELIRGHAHLVDGFHLLLDGKPARAREALAKAEAIGQAECSPWILYGVARARAHALKQQGRWDAAQEQGRIAVSLASTHGSAVRARWVREELDLLDASSGVTSRASKLGSPTLRTVRHQLASLVQIVRSPSAAREPSQHAAAILDDLLRDIDAERGTLWFEPDTDGRAQPFFSRQRRGDTWNEAEGFRTGLLRAVRSRGEPWPSSTGETSPAHLDAPVDTGRFLAVPLFLYETPVGALCLERDRRAPPFTEDERELLLVLAHQVPIALEIARLLAQRDQLQTSLQHAQKMEAVGQLAGGIAHDFNNMLMVIETSLDTLRERTGPDDELLAEVDLIGHVAGRAGELTKQLLGFSRHRPLPLAQHQPNALLEAIAPMLQRVLGPRKLLLELASELPTIHTDRASFEQAIVNLAVNARDAMPNGGTLTIRSERVRSDHPTIRRHAPGVDEQVVVSISDTGQGMPPELRDRVFEPFFTTKPLGGGTGLGLTTVYTFMKSCEGFVDVASEVGEGTTFRLCFPAAAVLEDVQPSSIPAPKSARSAGVQTVLVVDDDPLVARSIQKVLSRNGYNVLVAHGAQDALELVQRPTVSVAMAVIDVLMPGMSGPELGRRLLERNAAVRLLYVSGFAPENVGQVDPVQVLQKPFSAIDLVSRVRLVLETAHLAPS